MIGVFNGDIYFPHKLLVNDAQLSRLRKAFANNSSDNIKLSKTQHHKTVQLGGFFGFLESWTKQNRKQNNQKCGLTRG